MPLQNALGNLALDASVQSLRLTDPDGTVQVSPEATGLMLDSYDGTLATLWTAAAVSGGAAPTSSASVLTFGSSTTASAGSIIRTNNTYLLRASAYLKSAHHVQFEASAVITNNTRWWGIGTNQGTPTAAAPVLNGGVFEFGYADGLLYAVIYANGARTAVTALTRPTDGNYHKYEVWYRQSRIDWTIDGTLVATRPQPPLTSFQSPYVIGGSINHTTAPSTAPIMRWSGASISDTGANNRTMSDGVNPTIMQTVKAASTAVVAADFPAAVGLHPSSPLPAGTNALGSVTVSNTPAVSLAAGTNLAAAVGIQGTTPSASYYTSTGTNAAIVAKTAAGYIQALVITNTSANTQWVKVYNATSVTLGTTAAVLDIPLASGATLSLNTGANGVRMTTGIAYAITGAVGATNNTANTAGVLIALTYV